MNLSEQRTRGMVKDFMQELMYFGSRERPVGDVVAEAMEAEDASVVNNYIKFLMAHAFNTENKELYHLCNEIQIAHHMSPFRQPPASANNLPRRMPEGEECPECLRTPEAEALWQRLREGGFIAAGGYALAAGVSNNQATYIADCMAARLDIQHKWKIFQQLWKIPNMAQLAGSWQQTGKLPPRAEEIDRALKVKKRRLN